MILLNQLNDRIEPLPSVTDQLSFIDENSEKSRFPVSIEEAADAGRF